MMKYKIWSVVLAFSMLPMLIGCSSEDDNSGIIGTWVGYSCANSSPNSLSKDHPLTLVFNSDGSGNYLEIDSKYTYECSFIYEKESKTRAKAYISTRGNTQYYEIVDNKMYVYGHGYGDDLDFLLTKQ